MGFLFFCGRPSGGTGDNLPTPVFGRQVQIDSRILPYTGVTIAKKMAGCDMYATVEAFRLVTDPLVAFRSYKHMCVIPEGALSFNELIALACTGNGTPLYHTYTLKLCCAAVESDAVSEAALREIWRYVEALVVCATTGLSLSTADGMCDADIPPPIIANMSITTDGSSSDVNKCPGELVSMMYELLVLTKLLVSGTS